MSKIADIVDDSGNTVGSIVSVGAGSGCILWVPLIVLVALVYPVIMVFNYIRDHGLIGLIFAIPLAALFASIGAVVISNKISDKRGKEWTSFISFVVLLVISFCAFGTLLTALFRTLLAAFAGFN